jgi:hypothetical protein
VFPGWSQRPVYIESLRSEIAMTVSLRIVVNHWQVGRWLKRSSVFLRRHHTENRCIAAWKRPKAMAGQWLPSGSSQPVLKLTRLRHSLHWLSSMRLPPVRPETQLFMARLLDPIWMLLTDLQYSSIFLGRH